MMSVFGDGMIRERLVGRILLGLEILVTSCAMLKTWHQEQRNYVSESVVQMFTKVLSNAKM